MTIETVRRIELPEGLDWETVMRAVEIVEDWETRADGLATELTIALYECFRSGGR